MIYFRSEVTLFAPEGIELVLCGRRIIGFCKFLFHIYISFHNVQWKIKKPSRKKTGRQKDAVPPEFAENDALNFSLTQRKTDILPNTDSAATFC